jgi:hypothetical protein
MWMRPSDATAIAISFWFPGVSFSLTRTFAPNGGSIGPGGGAGADDVGTAIGAGSAVGASGVPSHAVADGTASRAVIKMSENDRRNLCPSSARS